jgi:hypothetical protein
MIDVEALRRARCDTGMGNTLLRGRWEMYRSFLGEMTAYPCNQFSEAPMTDAAQTKAIAEAALRNLTRAGVIAPAGDDR